MTRRSNLTAFLVACAGIALYCCMDALMKSLGLVLGAFSALFWRTLASIPMTGALLLSDRPRWPPPHLLRLHLIRGTVVAGMAILWFYGITLLPLAEAVSISFIAPLIALVLAGLFLGERIGWHAILASLLGIAGVGVILAARIQGDYDEGALIGAASILCSAVLYAINLVIQRHQAQQAPAQEIAFFINAVMLLWLLPFAPRFVSLPAAEHWPLIVGAALCATVSLLALTWAYARAEAQLLVVTEYTGFIWLAILGWVFFGEAVTMPTIIGAVLIVAGCLIATRGPATPKPQTIEAAL